MASKVGQRMVLTVQPARKARWAEAARRSRAPLSDWARRLLDEAADELLGAEAPEPGTPTQAQVRATLAAAGSLGRDRAERLRRRVNAAKGTPWRGQS